MRWPLLILFIFSASFKPEEGSVLLHRFIVLPASQLTILGKSNVKNFQCAIVRYSGADTLVLQEGDTKGRPVFY